ncbi:hypothetical protein ACFVSW_24870 [Neobacillus sp. NPDC058068]|uniref:hypothetical protein n=1 Tax=Neobacillus sp. NPDC058068 TaxID=3346325 RepID=UPI0036DBF76A
MRKRLEVSNIGFTPFRPGEPLFETERIASQNYLPVLKNEKQDVGGFWDFIKPDKDEYKGISKALKFLKFNEDEAKKLYDLIGGAINLASSIFSVVGMINTVTDLAKQFGLFGSKEMTDSEQLKEIGARVEQIYEYLKNTERRELYDKSLEWRSKIQKVREDLWNTGLSRSPQNLHFLKECANNLDDAITKMLDTRKADIAFQQAAYGYGIDYPHWISIAYSPLIKRADGQKIPNYWDPKKELQTNIWDAGYYIDVLFAALRERLIVTTAIEPAFRSTGFERQVLLNIANGLRNFIDMWRASILVVDPALGINFVGQLNNPLYYPYPGSLVKGILIGAVDPVTGISSIQSFDGFEIRHKESNVYEYGGSWAVEPEKALTATMKAHAAAVDSVIQACGINSLAKLESQFRAAASPPRQSQFVQLPDAKFRFHPKFIVPRGLGNIIIEEGTPETIDLGNLKDFADDPNKTYPAMRYHREMEKTFRFKMARRAEMSGIQLGYRLRIAGKDIKLCPFSSSPPEGIPSEPFPSKPIELKYQFTTDVYDCCQIRHFSASDEDTFEREGENGERVFHNMRKGRGHIQISVQFVPLVGGANDAHAGEAVVTIRNLEPNAFPDAFILDVSVYETIFGSSIGTTEEFEADSITIHMTPSYLIVGKDFFDDRWKALLRMFKAKTRIIDKFALEDLITMVPTKPNPEPAWNIRRQALEIENSVAFIQEAMRAKPELVTEEIRHLLPPQIRK